MEGEQVLANDDVGNAIAIVIHLQGWGEGREV